MKQDIENIIKKWLKKHKDDGQWVSDYDGEFDLDSCCLDGDFDLNDLADEVLKVVVETTSEEIQKDLDEGLFYKICSNETTFKNYVIGLLSEHLSPNKENKNNEK